MAMKVYEIQKSVKGSAFTPICDLFENAIQIGDYEIAVPFEVDGATRYARVSVVCGQLADTKKTPKFDPEVARENYLADLEFKAKVAAEKAAAKAAKVK